MKHQQKSNDEIDTNQLLIDSSSEDLDEALINGTATMMADSSFDATGTKILMPHELVASGSANASGLVGQHSIHSAFNDLHGASFYHTPTAATTTLGTGFNGFHNSTFHNYSQNNLNGTIMTTNSSSFNTLIHQQPITLSNVNHHPVTTTMPPPLIPYHQNAHQTSFYTTAATTASSNMNINQKEKSAESAVTNVDVEEHPIKSENETTEEAPVIEEAEEPEIDIVISNVVCAFSVRCHLALKEIALHGANVEYKRENGMVTMKLRKPYTTASIWSSGKITCTGATSEEMAKVAARRYARMLQKLNFRVRFQNYRVVNVLGTCKMPWAIKIVQFSEKYKKEASYEPELHPGVTYNLKDPCTATLKIFSTGSMTVTARSVANVQAAIEHIYPLVYEFKKPRADTHGEEQILTELIETDPEDFDDDDDDIMEPTEDPLEIEDEPPNKKQKLRDVSHLTKRFKGSSAAQKQKRRGSKRPLGKMNDPKEDILFVSDGEIDGDDF